MREINIKNPKILATPYTIIGDNYDSGTTLTVEDTSGFSENDLLLIGGAGNEKTEVTDVTVAIATKTAFTITALNFIHQADEPVQKILWDKFDIQYKISSSGDWLSLGTSVDFDWNKNVTSYIHQDGASGYYYRSRYYNSALEKYSSWSNIVAGTGFERNQAGYILNLVKKKTKTEKDSDVTDDYIFSLFNELQDIVKGFNKRFWFLKEEHTFDTQASISEYSELPSDYDRGHRLKFNYVNGAIDKIWDLHYKTPKEFDYLTQDQTVNDNDYLSIYTIDEINQTIKVGPSAPETAELELTLVYYKELSDIESYSDELLIPLPSLYLHYACKSIFADKENASKHNYHNGELKNLLEILQQMKPRVDRPKSISNFQGRKGLSRRAGVNTEYSDEYREQNW